MEIDLLDGIVSSRDLNGFQKKKASVSKLNYKQIYAKKAERESRIKKVCPSIPYSSGIYVFYRDDESGLKMCYCGQAVSLCERCASHLAEYDHIGLSLKKRGFYNEENQYGWKLIFKTCPKSDLDENEKLTIKQFADKGFQLYNVTSGGQGKGKTQIGEFKPTKGYQDGLLQGRKNASKEISHLFEKHLNYSTKSDKPNKNQQKAVEKFEEFLRFYKKEGKE